MTFLYQISATVAIVLLSGIKDAKVAVVGFIGPIPVGFGNDPRLLQIALIIGIIIFVAIFLFLFR